MTTALQFHKFINDHNILQEPTEQATEYLHKNPTLYKIALLINHLFRAVAMVALMLFLPFSTPINCLLCFAGSLFYRLTVENNCAYKFALPAFGGSIALLAAHRAVTQLISRAAFASLGALATTYLLFIPFCAYAAYTILTVSYDADNRCGTY